MRTDRSPMLPPTSCAFGGCTTAGMSDAMPSALCEVGMTVRVSRVIVFCWVSVDVSMSGVAPDTVMLSSSEPSFSSTFSVAVKLGASSMPSRRRTEKPGRV
jgi:hypothetical protein